MKKFGKRLVASSICGAVAGVASYLVVRDKRRAKETGLPTFGERVGDALVYLRLGCAGAWDALTLKSECEETDVEDMEPAPEEESGWSCPEAREEFFVDPEDEKFDELMERFSASDKPVFDSDGESSYDDAEDEESDWSEFASAEEAGYFGENEGEEQEEPDYVGDSDESGVEFLDKDDEDECAESSDEDFETGESGTVIPFPEVK